MLAYSSGPIGGNIIQQSSKIFLGLVCCYKIMVRVTCFWSSLQNRNTLIFFYFTNSVVFDGFHILVMNF